MNWNDIQLFLTIAEEGSFRQAAQRLNLGHATLSRRIESFEERLNVKVFNRQTTGLSLTEAGEEILSAVSPVRSVFDDLKVRLYGRDQALEGKITLTLPEYLSTHLVLPALTEFQEAWPQVTIELRTDYKILDLHNQEADIAIRATNKPDEQLIGRNVGGMYQAAYASREYLARFLNKSAGEPVRAHNWIRTASNATFKMSLYKEYDNGLPVGSNLVLFDIDAQMTAAKLGKGIATLPCLIGDQSDQLVRISEVSHRFDLWLLCHKDLRNNRRMQLFRAFLVTLLENNHDLMTGLSCPQKAVA